MVRRDIVLLMLSTLLVSRAWTQEPNPLPTIKATSKAITILDGDDALHGELVPDLNPDTYVYHPSGKVKTISYVTDIDRIDFQVEPGQTYDFAILYEGKTCHQRIVPTGPNAARYQGQSSGDSKGDVIPFTLGENNFLHLRGSINGSETLDLIFDTGASVCVLSEKGRAKGATVREGTDNRLKLADIVIENTPVKFIDYRGRFSADGIVGYNCFVGKVVWIDHEKNQLVIDDELPDIPKGYQKTDLIWRGASTLVEVTLDVHGKSENVLALFDTGSRWSLSLRKSEPFVATHFATLPSLGVRKSSMSDGHRVTSNVVELPEVTIAGFRLENVQTDLEDPSGPDGLFVNILGNDFLKRFNAIIDYQRSELYLLPNHIRSEPYNSVFSWKVACWSGAAAFAVALTIPWVYWRRKLARR